VSQIPTGVVTLLFSDIAGSTRLWEAEPASMASALRHHDEILRSSIESAGGYVFKTVGDAFCAAFETPRVAVGAAVSAQLELRDQAWPTSRPVLVRMGLHTGECEERDNDYFGPEVNRTARLEAIAHGGQVIMSGTTADLLDGSLPVGVRLRDLGQHRLRDLGRPEHVFQVEAPGLPAEFPALASLDNPELPNNLPGVLSTFVGRSAELTAVQSLLAESRLVTLTGAGGCGKTRLALHVAADQLGSARDGVWFVELAPLTDGAEIPGVVSAVLGLPTRDEGSLIASLRDQNALIVLDNCEHLIDAAAALSGRMVRDCRQVRILATSREPLGIDGERVYRVASLSCPSPEPADLTSLASSPCPGSPSEAVQLFVDRARAQDPGFVLDRVTEPLVASICRRLDGIPLAIELAAARLSSMSLSHLSARLDQRFRLLTGGSRNAMPRQQTLQAAVDWSFGLLSDTERATLRRLCVFTGGFELEAAEAVCTTAEVDAFEVLDLLASLVDKSLVVADRSPSGSVRYRLLETIRQYCAQELLRADGEQGVLAARTRHAEYYLTLAEEARSALTSAAQGEWLRRLSLETENLRAAVDHLAAEDRTEDVLRTGAALERFILSHGHLWLLAALRAAIARAPVAPSPVLADALDVCSSAIMVLLVNEPGERATAREYAGRQLAMARALGDPRREAAALSNLATTAYFAGDLDRMRDLAREGLRLARQAGDLRRTGTLLNLVGFTAPSPADGLATARESLECFRQAGDLLGTANALSRLYGVNLHADNLAEARGYLREAIEIAEGLEAGLFMYFLHNDLAILLLIDDKPAEALPLIRRNLMIARRVGEGVERSMWMFAAACCASRLGPAETAARLHGAADRYIADALALGTIAWSPPEQELRERSRSQLRALMGEEAYEAATHAGAGLSGPDVLELALEATLVQPEPVG
jgi:predicted ATPase/class 3 adenylate cyclase